MSQKKDLLELFQKNSAVHVDEAKQNGIKHPRQQVYFLRQNGYRIINTGKNEYRLL